MSISTKIGRNIDRGYSPGPRFFKLAGFSLIELMVVVAVIGIMAALLLPALAKTKEQARGTACRSNMKQLALAFLMYSEDNNETFPWPGGVPGRAVKSPTQYAADWCASDDFAANLNLQSEFANLLRRTTDRVEAPAALVTCPAPGGGEPGLRAPGLCP